MDIHTKNRFIYVVIGAILFSLVGVVLPDTYFRYLDQTEYIKYVHSISFDKKVYHACEQQTAKADIQILVNANVEIKGRLYLVLDKGNNQFQIVKDYSYKSFLKEEPNVQSLFTTVTLPCDLKHGVYFYRGVLSYTIRGIEKTTGFSSDTFTIDGGE